MSGSYQPMPAGDVVYVPVDAQDVRVALPPPRTPPDLTAPNLAGDVLAGVGLVAFALVAFGVVMLLAPSTMTVWGALLLLAMAALGAWLFRLAWRRRRAARWGELRPARLLLAGAGALPVEVRFFLNPGPAPGRVTAFPDDAALGGAFAEYEGEDGLALTTATLSNGQFPAVYRVGDDVHAGVFVHGADAALWIAPRRR
jgi:hypothetical protein